VYAGGRGSNGTAVSPYDNDVVTYAPASTRDTADEIPLSAGEEKTVNIRYRSQPGYVISGTRTTASRDSGLRTHINIARFVGATSETVMSYESTIGEAFELFGIANGDYVVWSESDTNAGDVFVSDPQNIRVAASDVTGLKLIEKSLATVAGELVFEHLQGGTCGQNRPSVSPDETLVLIKRDNESMAKEQALFSRFGTSQSLPNDNGRFVVSNLDAGHYSIEVHRVPRFWYVRSIVQQRSAQGSRATDNEITDLALTSLELKRGDRVSGVKITLTEGAASIGGHVDLPEGQQLPIQLFVYLVPADNDLNDVMRYFAVPVNADLSFAFSYVPPGRYLSFAQITSEPNLMTTAALRLPAAAKAREKLRSEIGRQGLIDLRPCQEITDYRLPFKPRV